ncbi:MAG: hypothetical protein GXY32_07615 [Ruminococcaceae bacterium]|nr:hypothetical protein [Oscillospiraceae bacterium]
MERDEWAALPGRLVLVEQNNNFGMSLEGALANMHLLPEKPLPGKEILDMKMTIIPL